MTRRIILVLALTLGAFAAMSTEAEDASAQIRVGAHGGYNFDVEEGLVGADLWVGIFSLSEAIQIHGNASFHWYFADEGLNLWGLDLNVPVLFKLGTDIVRPYAGIGLAIFHAASDNDTIEFSDTTFAFNILGGAMFLADGRFNPYVQFRYYIADNSGGELIGGVMFKF
jgi:hypothetical protein